jgi:hypothetical protein
MGPRLAATAPQRLSFASRTRQNNTNKIHNDSDIGTTTTTEQRNWRLEKQLALQLGHYSRSSCSRPSVRVSHLISSHLITAPPTTTITTHPHPLPPKSQRSSSHSKSQCITFHNSLYTILVHPLQHYTMSTPGSSLFDSGFDYQNLLPTRSSNNANAGSHSNASTSSDDGSSGANGGCFPALSYRERILGCATCMVAGYLLSMGSLWRIKDLVVNRDPLPFVMNATIGNILALAGSFFLSGPKHQMERMWHDKRRTATALYLSSLGLTLCVAFLPIPVGKGLLLLLLMICQYVSIAWYTLSYIPFAHEAIRGYIQHVRTSGGGDSLEY